MRAGLRGELVDVRHGEWLLCDAQQPWLLHGARSFHVGTWADNVVRTPVNHGELVCPQLRPHPGSAAMTPSTPIVLELGGGGREIKPPAWSAEVCGLHGLLFLTRSPTLRLCGASGLPRPLPVWGGGTRSPRELPAQEALDSAVGVVAEAREVQIGRYAPKAA